MEKWRSDWRRVYGDRAYILLLSLVAACGYGFKIVHPVMGIDDTPYAYYFEEGLAAVVGRWVLFLLNKVVHIAEFAPFITDLAAVLLLMAAVSVWGLLFYRVLGDRIPKYGYWLFSCIFLSCPLISEVFTYFLHNGIAIGYLSCGLSLGLMQEGLERVERRKSRQAVGLFALSAALLVVAMGCYESFMIVWLVGIFLILLSERLAGGTRRPAATRGLSKARGPSGVFGLPCIKLAVAAVTAAAAMLLRSIVLKIVIAAFGLGYLREAAVQRSLAEIAGWMLQPGARAEFAMVLKRVFVQYVVFAHAYYPIKIFVLASLVICLCSLGMSIRRRDVGILLLTAGCFVAAFLLTVVEGKATLYRSAQFVPLICGYGILMAVYAVSGAMGAAKRRGIGNTALRRGAGAVCAVVSAVILWNQCADLNHWFYVDYRKYEYAKEYMAQVALELEQNFDTSKPVVFTGEWENPEGLVEDAYVRYDDPRFYEMKRITDLVDEHLLEKYYRGYGVWVAQTPALSVISWGKYAFDNDEELIRFMAFHGHGLLPHADGSYYTEAENYAADMPHFPREGSIVDAGDYIIVHF
ncbi:MAG: glucosyltransferase domain-containing protein [Clostridium sp.]|nr:glucosyltransferase domain-containing protein [Acetatifactor muris]MCM1525904.1 glucosyltransferase domain-containing protein [Bacteroides sp.]MCM1562557.1 glucosyltransferase domain-containing protein [Clostridium sp.]